MKHRGIACSTGFGSRRVAAAAVAVTLAAALTAPGCGGCGKPAGGGDAAGEPGKGVRIPPGQGAAGGVHEAGPAVLPEATIVERGGSVGIERSPETLESPVLAEKADDLFAGDFLTTGKDGSAVIDVGMETRMTVAASSRVQVGTHRPLEIVIHSGIVRVEGPALRGLTRRFLLTTPGGIVFHAGPAMTVAVAPDASVLVDVTDCPLAEPPPPSIAKKGLSTSVQQFRCAFVAGQGEEELVTGDRLVIGTGAVVSRSRIDSGGPDPAAWLAGREAAMAEGAGKTVAAFAAWIVPAVADASGLVERIDANRLRNKELIKALRDLREKGKADASKDGAKAPEGQAGSQDPGITEVKDELAKNSGEQFGLRHVLLARFSQISLGMEILGGLLTEADLASSGTGLEALAASIADLDSKVSALMDRPPRMKVSAKPPVPLVKKQATPVTPKSAAKH